MGANGRRRVVITGLGAVTPLASDIATSWQRLIGGRSAAAAIKSFDASGFAVGFACEAREFDATRWIERKQARQMDRVAQLVVAAARQAEVDSGIVIEEEPDRVGASVATAMGGMKSFEDCCDTVIERARPRQSVRAAGGDPEHERRLALDRARHARAGLGSLHRLRRLADGDRRRPRCDPA
jgi:3-oxoacyl-(acyl-carrier-protein) synthase